MGVLGGSLSIVGETLDILGGALGTSGESLDVSGDVFGISGESLAGLYETLASLGGALKIL